MSNLIVGALTAVPVTFLAWLAYNWAGEPILDVRSKRLDALKAAELYGFTGYGHGEDKESRAKDGLIEAATSLRALNRGQPWSARLYCRLLVFDLEFAASVLSGLAGLVKLLRLLQTKRIKAKDLDGRLRFTTESLREFLDALPDALEAERQAPHA